MKEVVFLWDRALVAFVDKLSSTTVEFIRSEGELKNWMLYGFQEVLESSRRFSEHAQNM